MNACLEQANQRTSAQLAVSKQFTENLEENATGKKNDLGRFRVLNCRPM
jgi:hypothetical protein